jgi:hypothetical protein
MLTKDYEQCKGKYVILIIMLHRNALSVTQGRGLIIVTKQTPYGYNMTNKGGRRG